jgi:hypothetical protein
MQLHHYRNRFQMVVIGYARLGGRLRTGMRAIDSPSICHSNNGGSRRIADRYVTIGRPRRQTSSCGGCPQPMSGQKLGAFEVCMRAGDPIQYDPWESLPPNAVAESGASVAPLARSQRRSRYEQVPVRTLLYDRRDGSSGIAELLLQRY